jgi:CRP-like cAMP-binding protein
MFQSEGRPVSNLLLIEQGWSVGSILLSGGARQIVSLYLPGDIANAEAIFTGVATETITPVVDMTYRLVDLTRVREMIECDQALTSALLRYSLASTTVAKNHLTSVGRTPAAARIAGLLVQIAVRLGHSPDSGACEFECPLSQEHIGDYTGLTSVHINRTLMRLAAAGLISRNGYSFHIPDLAALARESELPPVLMNV